MVPLKGVCSSKANSLIVSETFSSRIFGVFQFSAVFYFFSPSILCGIFLVIWLTRNLNNFWVRDFTWASLLYLESINGLFFKKIGLKIGREHGFGTSNCCKKWNEFAIATCVSCIKRLLCWQAGLDCCSRGLKLIVDGMQWNVPAIRSLMKK